LPHLKGHLMHNLRIRTVAILISLACSTAADAHFLFLRLLPAAEGGRFAEVYFSDDAQAGDPRFIDKIANTKLWQQVKPGQFELLHVRQTTDRLRALVPSSGATSVIGECTYGVLARPKQAAFLLRHYPKAVEGRPEEIAALLPKKEIPFEIVMHAIGDELEFTALRQGKPIADAAFVTVGLDLKGHKFAANKDGKARWKPSTPGYFAVYTSQTLKQAGTHDGTKYDEIRAFATLAFPWPLHREGADAAAVKLFQDAIAARASWKNFPGFRADVSANADGRVWKGSVSVSAKGDVEIDMSDDVVTPWVNEQLESMAMHRIDRPASKAPVMRFADQERAHPLGRLLTFEGGQFASSYRVKEEQLIVVNRLLGKGNMTITVLENELNADKKYLPRSYTVQYWHNQSGDLQRSETVQNRWTRVGGWDLPAHLSVLTASPAGYSVKTMLLSTHRLMNAKK
jgi:hypothetical protein